MKRFATIAFFGTIVVVCMATYAYSGDQSYLVGGLLVGATGCLFLARGER